MVPKSVVVFCLILFFSCSGGGGGGSGATSTEIKKEDGKTEDSPPEAPVSIQLEVVPASKTMKPGDTFTFSAKGGEPPYTFSAQYGEINSETGVYTFAEGIKEGDVVQVRDNKQKVVSSIIFGDFSNLWTWMGGSNLPNQTGVYGLVGTESPTNIPGARYGGISWADGSGNLWLFGGSGYGYSPSGDGYLNDLWKFNSSTKQWSWMGGNRTVNQNGIYGQKGVASSSNNPGSRREAVSWSVSNGDLWLFGGVGYASSGAGYLNDLWKYNITTNQWTWVSGSDSIYQNGIYGQKGLASSSNNPGSRRDAVSWSDSNGNLWLFGGDRGPGGFLPLPYGWLNDLWKYNIATNQWTWVGGSDYENPKGIYGQQGSASPGDVPAARVKAVSWSDSNGNLWLFGGEGHSFSGSGYLNDLWKFNPGTNQWTWVGGSIIPYQKGIYGQKGLASSSNNPGSRRDAVSWSDSNGNLWLFGGFGYSSSGSGYLNDLWKFNTTSKQWTWVAGSNSYNIYGDYGTPTYIPGVRHSAFIWLDTNGNLWLFGGGGYSSSSNGNLNDLWKFTPPKD